MEGAPTLPDAVRDFTQGCRKDTNGLLAAHLASSDSAALGGELATRYAAGGESALSLGVVHDTLQDTHFGHQTQTVGSRFASTVCGYRLD